MPITDRLVLPVDVTLVPVGELRSGLRSRLRARPGEYALTRPRGRAATRLVSPEGARLLGEFREPRRIADAVRRFASRHDQEPEAVLAQAFPLLRDCFNDRFLVPAASPDAAPILPTRERGDRIGRFAVLRLVQLRDDTELYQCRDRTGTLAAVKLVRPGRAADLAPLLRREAAVLRHLGGRGAPRLLGQGRHRSRPWLAMMWCPGVPPSQALRDPAGSAGQADRLRLAIRIGQAYSRLHRSGILHGDVHPENLLVGRSGEIVLLDFGLAVPVPPLRLAGRAPRGGVAPYLPPEFAASALAGRGPAEPNPHTEQYAVGALLYTLATGRSYADFALEREAMLRQIVSEPPAPFARRGVPPWPALEAVLRRALEKDAARRFPSMHRLTRALREVRIPAERRSPVRPDGRLRERVVRRFLTDAREQLGRGWPPPSASVMLGGAGVAYALYRLASRRDDPEALALADAWLTRTEALVESPTAFAGPGPELSRETLGTTSPFHARSGVHLVRALIAGALGDLPAVESATRGFLGASHSPGASLDLTLGRSATLLGSAFLLEAGGTDRNPLRAELRALGDGVCSGIWRELRSTDVAASGIAHGWAGILYATLRWVRTSGAELPPAFAGALERLARRAEPYGRGLRWWGPEAGEDIAGWCNGPAGFIHLWTLAAGFAGETDSLSHAEGSAWSAWEARTSLANLCCGLGGRAYGLLRFYQHTGRKPWLERARVLAARAMEAMLDNRLSREFPLSLFKGSAGIAVLAADLDRPERAAMPFFDPEGWPV